MKNVTVITGAYSPSRAHRLAEFLNQNYGHDVLVRTNDQETGLLFEDSGFRTYLIPLLPDAESLGNAFERLAFGEEIFVLSPVDMESQAILTFMLLLGKTITWFPVNEDGYECVPIADYEELRSLINALKE